MPTPAISTAFPPPATPSTKPSLPDPTPASADAPAFEDALRSARAPRSHPHKDDKPVAPKPPVDAKKDAKPASPSDDADGTDGAHAPPSTDAAPASRASTDDQPESKGDDSSDTAKSPPEKQDESEEDAQLAAMLAVAVPAPQVIVKPVAKKGETPKTGARTDAVARPVAQGPAIIPAAAAKDAPLAAADAPAPEKASIAGKPATDKPIPSTTPDAADKPAAQAAASPARSPDAPPPPDPKLAAQALPPDAPDPATKSKSRQPAADKPVTAAAQQQQQQQTDVSAGPMIIAADAPPAPIADVAPKASHQDEPKAPSADAAPLALGLASGKSADPAAASATSASAAQDSPHADHDSTFDQIVLGLRSNLDPRSGKAEITLQPPSLGKLQVSISLDNGSLTAHFRAASDSVRDLLSSNLDKLKTTLESQGVAVDRLAVNAGPEAGSTGGSPGGNNSSFAGSPGHDGHSAGEYSRRGPGQQNPDGRRRPENSAFAAAWQAARAKPIDVVA